MQGGRLTSRLDQFLGPTTPDDMRGLHRAFVGTMAVLACLQVVSWVIFCTYVALRWGWLYT